MLSLEEKQAILVKKWQALHKMVSPKKECTATVPYKAPVAKQGEGLNPLAAAIWEASGRDLKSIVPPGVKNQSWYLLNLKGKIDWFGNVAIGADKYFEGWWNVVPPSGCTISYFGPGAEGRAVEMAKKITSYYP